MTRNFYSNAIFFTGLYILTSIFQSFIFFKLGARVYELPALAGWLILVYLVTLIWSMIMLKYYYYKQYWFTFWVLIISVIASLFHVILFFSILFTREVSIYYIIGILAVPGVGIVYGISLIFSRAGERPWLKAAGVFTFVFELFLMTSTLWALYSIGVRLNGTSEKIEQWASLIVSLGPVLFIMNFLREKATATEANTSRQEFLGALVNILAIVTFGSILFFGQKLAIETFRAAGNPNNVTDGARRSAQPFEARTYVNSLGDTLRYRLLKPMDYDSMKRYPLVVCLHGSSGCGTDNVKQVVTSWPAQLLSNRENRTNYPAFLFVPQCPPRNCWGGIPDVPAVDSLVFESILSLKEEFAIDANRCYVSGNSLGGYGAWHFVSTRPEMFAAAIPISGSGDPELAPRIVNIPVWAFHGAKDRNVPVSGSRDMIKAIKNAGGDPRYTEYPDEAHHIWNSVTDTPGLLDWLFAQKKN